MKKTVKAVLAVVAIILLAVIGYGITRLSMGVVSEYGGDTAGEPDPMFDIQTEEPEIDISSPEEDENGATFSDKSAEWEDTAVTPIS